MLSQPPSIPRAQQRVGGSSGGDSGDGCLASRGEGAEESRGQVGIRLAAMGSLKEQGHVAAGLMPEGLGDTSWDTPTPVTGRKRRPWK